VPYIVSTLWAGEKGTLIYLSIPKSECQEGCLKIVFSLKEAFETRSKIISYRNGLSKRTSIGYEMISTFFIIVAMNFYKSKKSIATTVWIILP